MAGQIGKFISEVLHDCGYRDNCLLKIEDIEKITSIKRRFVLDLINDGHFPKPFKIKGNGNRNYWYKRDIVDWIDSLQGAHNGESTSSETKYSGSKFSEPRRMAGHERTSSAVN
jgi:predicted DNA-binding transcriptional regulator AlpA